MIEETRYRIGTEASIKKAAFICCLSLLIFLVSSKFLLSVSMIVLLLLGLQNKNVLSLFWKNKAYVSISLIFFIILLSGLYSSNLNYWLERVQIKLPLLVLPIAFAGLPHFSLRELCLLLYAFLGIIFLCSLGVGINYFMHYEEINLAIKQSQAMPTPINHIRFSLLMALSIISGGYLIKERFYFKKEWEKGLIIGLTLFLLFFIHVLSVRSGILSLYGVIGVMAIRYPFVTGRWKLGLFLMIGVISLPIIAYNLLPSFKTKAELLVWNYKMYQEGKIEEYSDTKRLVSYEMGLKVGNQNPIIGVGAGDIKEEVDRVFQENYPKIEPLFPHNQFLFFYAATGILGTLIFIGAFLFPLFYQKNNNLSFILALHVVVFFSFLVENTLETSVGVAFYVFFLVLSLNYMTGLHQSSKVREIVLE